MVLDTVVLVPLTEFSPEHVIFQELEQRVKVNMRLEWLDARTGKRDSTHPTTDDT